MLCTLKRCVLGQLSEETEINYHITQLPDKFQDWYKRKFGKDPTAELLSFMERELYHAIITLLLNPELKEAYLHGTDFEFWDGVVRRMFPRFFIHSMDYKER